MSFNRRVEKPQTPILDPAKVPDDWEEDIFGLVYPKSRWDRTEVRSVFRVEASAQDISDMLSEEVDRNMRSIEYRP